MVKALTAVIALGMLAGCGGGGLHDTSTNISGPDEFSVLPSRRLQMPATNALPAPTPGAANLADPADPRAQAVAALGGRQPADAGVSSADVALVQAASRYGVSGNIRTTLATEDRALRSGSGFGGLFGGNRYFALYANQRLDAAAELARLRALGIETPTAPPQ